MKCLGKAFPQIDARDIVVFGISGDPVEKQARFAKALGLKFKLLSDTDYEVARSYGVFVSNPKGGFASRSVFLVNKEGKLHYANRNFPPPRTLEGTELETKINELGTAEPDPLEVVSKLPSPEKEGKTAVVRFVQAVLIEDIRATDRALHPAFGTRPGEPDSKQKERRRNVVDFYRTLYRDYDVRGTCEFKDVLDLANIEVHEGDEAKRLAEMAHTDDKKQLSKIMADDDLLVSVRTSAPEVTRTDEEGEEHKETVFPADIVLIVRADADTWRVFATGTR